MNGEFLAHTVRLETPRLLLRPWNEDDLNDFYAYAKVDGVGQMAGWNPHKDLAESRRILAMFIEEDKTLCIQDKETGKAIGSIGLEYLAHLGPELDPLRGREIGYVLSKDFWGRGLMPEAVRAVIDYCFGTLHYDFLTCGYFQWNSQSRRVNEKLGFQFYKEIPFETRYNTVETTNLNLLWNPEREEQHV